MKVRLMKPGVLQYFEEREPELTEHQMLVKVAYCGICGADIKSFRRGHHDLEMPRILGHEITGVIQAVGKNILSQWKPGDRVQIFPGSYCGECYYCRKGQDNLCETMQIMGFNLDGGLQEFIVINRQIQEKMLNLIPENLSLAQATLAEPLACAINMQDKLSLCPADSLLILGAGRLGMLNYYLAKHKGIHNVVIADPYGKRLDETLYERSINMSGLQIEDIRKKLASFTGSRGVGAVIICTPAPDALTMAIELVQKGGRIGYFSSLSEAQLCTKQLNKIHYKELIVTGSYGCTMQGNREALQRLSQGLLPTNKLDMQIFNLQDTQRAIEMLENKKIISAVISL